MASNADCETKMSMKPLLDTYRDDNEDASPVSFVRSIDTTFISHKYILVVHAIFIAINATIFFIYTRSLLNNGRLSGSNWDLLPCKESFSSSGKKSS